MSQGRQTEAAWSVRSRLRGARLMALGVAMLMGWPLVVLQGCGGNHVDNSNSSPDAALLRWNSQALNATGLDHTPSNVGPAHTFGQQVGPCRAARAMAIIHIAMFDVVNAIEQNPFQSYMGLGPADPNTSFDAAIAQAAHDTIVALFPSQAYLYDAQLTQDLAAIPDGPAKSQGIVLGQTAATAILQARANDGSVTNGAGPSGEMTYAAYVNTPLYSNQPGFWRQDPIFPHPLALGVESGNVTPFVMALPNQFRVPPPPDMTSQEYTDAYNEVLSVGRDTSVTRTQDQTDIGLYWAYDGTPVLCAPPRLYNQILVHIAAQQGTHGIELARLLALANTAMCEAGIAVWESKYFYRLWRPVTGIRESDPATGPSGLGDGNPATAGDVNWAPLGAPMSNPNSPPVNNFTPPFPAYPSGHAGFGGALFQVIRRFYGTDNIAFIFTSDELNGVTLDNSGNPRPFRPRSFANLTQAEEENGQSRIYLGIHWRFDKTRGITQGQEVGNWVFDHTFLPSP